MWTEPLLLAKCYLLRLILQLPPTDIICFTVTAWQHESNVDILISCTHGCLAEQASASEPFTPYLCKSGRQGLFTAAQREVPTFQQSLGMDKAAQLCPLPRSSHCSHCTRSWTGMFTGKLVIKKIYFLNSVCLTDFSHNSCME